MLGVRVSPPAPVIPTDYTNLIPFKLLNCATFVPLKSKLPFWLYFVNTADKRFFSWMTACLCHAMSLDQDEETIYADFNADAYNDLIEYQFSNIVKLMSGLVIGESIQEKVLNGLS